MHDDGAKAEGEGVPTAGEIQERLEDVMELAVRGTIGHTHSSTDFQNSKVSEEASSEGSTLRHRNRPITPSVNPAALATPTSQENGTETPIMKLRRLEPTDPRAIEFREKMRNWYATRPSPTPLPFYDAPLIPLNAKVQPCPLVLNIPNARPPLARMVML